MRLIRRATMKPSTTYLVTGVLGFIGSHVAQRLLAEGVAVCGVDSITDYYDVAIKHRRLAALQASPLFTFYHKDVAEEAAMASIWKAARPAVAIHLAAQAGVVHRAEQSAAYLHSNIEGFDTLLRQCAQWQTPLLYASSSSVYGATITLPYQERDSAIAPLNLYARSKLHNERTAALYREALGLPCVGLRLFSVYGEDMRPDLVIHKFVHALAMGMPITLFGDEGVARDFTYVGDVVRVICDLAARLQQGALSLAPIYNVGHCAPVSVQTLLSTLEGVLEKKAVEVRYAPLREGEMQVTYADTMLLKATLGYTPSTPLAEGLRRYWAWWQKQ